MLSAPGHPIAEALAADNPKVADFLAQCRAGGTSEADIESAEKLGFDAYGVSQDMPDPVARAIGQLLDHLHAVDGRLEGMCGALKALGSDYCAKDLPPLCDKDFAGVKEQGDTPSV